MIRAILTRYLRVGYRVVVFEHCFEQPRQMQRFRMRTTPRRQCRLFTLRAPVELVQ